MQGINARVYLRVQGPAPSPMAKWLQFFINFLLCYIVKQYTHEKFIVIGRRSWVVADTPEIHAGVSGTLAALVYLVTCDWFLNFTTVMYNVFQIKTPTHIIG